jgi:hypothetical protein
MLWSINTAWAETSMHRSLQLFKLCCLVVGVAACFAFVAETCRAQTITVPTAAVAGEPATLSISGSGKATFYLLGPGISNKHEISLGEEMKLRGDVLRYAGDYQVIVCGDPCKSATFFVSAAKPASLSFLVHPSRVPVSLQDAVSGVAFPFDQFHNLVLTPVAIDFQLATGNATVLNRTLNTQAGVAWFRTTSGKSAGALQVTASLGDVSAKRVVQQVASDPCNLRITGQRNQKGILVQTEPVHDCSGNPVPDGTVVSFTASAADGKSTVDAPIKKGIARAQIEATGPTVISGASGVVMGNEVRLGAQR